MKKHIRILFTSVGRRVELVQAYHKAAEELGIDLVIYGADMSDTAPAMIFCDKTEIVCRIKSPEYIPNLLEICKRERIDALIPTIDTDLLLLSQNKEQFAAIGTAVLISAEDKVKLCRDKRFTADFFIHCGLKSPIPVDDYTKYNGVYPAFIKPKDGSSSIDAYKVNNANELKSYAGRIVDYIIQPFIEGTEYTIDIFCDLEGNPIYITPRERVAVRSGEVLKTRIEQNDTMIEESMRLISEFRPCGAITVQLIQQKTTGDNYFIEINPRYGGGAPLSIKAGADSAKACLQLLTGEKVSYIPKAAMNHAVYSRFDQCICVNESKEPIKISRLSDVADYIDNMSAIIFDLDDTLYSEKQYVRSGYKAVASMLPEVKNAEEQLWSAFENKQSAIDYVLEANGIYSEELKNKCLDIYREHQPQITLYDEVKPLFSLIRNRNLKIGILTDGRPNGQRNKIEALGLASIVDEIVITDEIGGSVFRKPCDIPYRIMQKKLNVPFEKMVYVGDNIGKDFIAPAELGMSSIWYCNSNGVYITY